MPEKKYYSIEEIKRKLERYCAYQDRCHKEVEAKLANFSLIPEGRELILLHLMEHNFLNEERFAKSFARGKFKIKKWGKQRITQQLKLKEISAYTIKTALKEIDEEDYIKTIYQLAAKKNELIRESDSYKRKKKLVDFLIRKGYEFDLIFKVVDEELSD